MALPTTSPTPVYLELGPKKVFACSAAWPGWCRVGGSEELALDALMTYVPRYRVIAARAGLEFDPGEPAVVERVRGNRTTDFGAPAAVAALDREAVGEEEAARAVALIRAAWEVLGEVAAASPQDLRKGPRGGGRDRDKIVAHVVEAERAYARKIGVSYPPLRDEGALPAMRRDITDVLGRPSDGQPHGEKGWPARYAARRIAWHVIDHIWEIEDRRE
ncbi:hypothetical protein JOL79_09665 [Microbispora sp. RL4-1S]|uniref:DinB family protein n=1 Tax=Microbispora oryzae TaxID=2806554 RepID=A0A940WEI5_9ACTN|nr:hypothetical protein [Microbispora oryzae]MBP2704075.1 hypothetical protein [Microbispora oryzae]